MKQLRTLEDLSMTELEDILEAAGQTSFAGGAFHAAANLFFEPSTRTKYSFEMAEAKLGMHRFDFSAEASSIEKGESLYDTLKTFEAIGVDLFVIRHPRARFYEELEGLQVPVINAGDGAGNHPTQSLLDLYTMKEEFGSFRGLHVVICGDTAHSRVANTNAWILKRLGARVSYAGPDAWMPQEVSGGRVLSMDEAVEQADVMMMLRIQTERHDGRVAYTPETYHRRWGLTEAREQRMQPHAVIMHPAPVNRGVEIADSLVECRRSRIFKQMENGVKVRQAVLHFLLQSKGADRVETIS
ncbi:aspartate carbamoyltransferase catalytic subunit [Alkalicoccus chagannorensis]|uniref:aspartate carbamoyltransferase catalytic subunit n=1 Tax=Alkalicoccus chagannorensis TaxID=427072 RepID=UPI000413324E|nr:aspartate carbamoyltransferase catalytic subunit [Alkalicoccus chagannorensis]